MDPLIETSPQDVLARVEEGALSTWSEQKRSEFCLTFQARVRVARYLLIRTASLIKETAQRRHFISPKHNRAIFKGFLDEDSTRYGDPTMNSFIQYDPGPWTQEHGVGGRSVKLLEPIAKERAQTVLKSLPPLARAVEIIDQETAQKIDHRDRLLKEGERLREKLEEVCGTIEMGDLDQSMTIGAFRAMVRDRDAQRRKLLTRLNEIGAEGSKLEEEIAKKLYAGLPGLSEAVVEVIRTHLEQAFALDETCRRVEEQVKFGDSEAAVELLRHFEKDEMKVSNTVKAQFDNALQTLKESIKKKPKTKRSQELSA